MLDPSLLVTALRLEPATSAEYDYLRTLETAAVAYVERATGRDFGPVRSRTDVWEVAGVESVWLSEVPSNAASLALTLDGVAVDPTTYTLRERRLKHETLWGRAGYPVQLVATYDAGYAPDQEPPDIRAAVLELVARMYEYRVPIVTGTVVSEVPYSVEATLSHWRRLGL